MSLIKLHFLSAGGGGGGGGGLFENFVNKKISFFDTTPPPPPLPHVTHNFILQPPHPLFHLLKSDKLWHGTENYFPYMAVKPYHIISKEV